MRELKNEGVTIEIDEYARNLALSLNTIDAVQEKYNCSITDFGAILDNEKTRYAAIRFILFSMLAEDAEIKSENGMPTPIITEKAIGRMINLKNISYFLRKITEAISASIPESDSESEVEPAEKN